MDEQSKLGFEFAKEIATQLITLSTGFLALTITFTKELVKGSDQAYRSWLYWAWAFQWCSIVAGVWTLMALTGALTVGAGPGPVTAFAPSVRLPASLQVLFFLIAICLAVVYGVRTLRVGRLPESAPEVSEKKTAAEAHASDQSLYTNQAIKTENCDRKPRVSAG